MCRTGDLRQAVLARNDAGAQALREELAARGTVVVNMLSSPGSGKTELLQQELTLARTRAVPVAAITADLATDNDATRLARAGVPVLQVLTDGLCHLEAAMVRRAIDGWLPAETRVLFVENVGNLVCPASYDLGETLRVALASVTEGEDKPLKYPNAFGLAQLVLVTKADLADAVGFDEAAFRAHVERVNPGVEVVLTSARTGAGAGVLLDRALAAQQGTPQHRPVMARTQDPALTHHHHHDDGHTHDDGHHHDDGHQDGHGHDGHAHAEHGHAGHGHGGGSQHRQDAPTPVRPLPGHPSR
ncbi:hydrogenase nickel incorporation protein HypB [Streptacidiphilus sp. EB129]|uniref:hydrogenase nickel incorporation protein HypB n=1 Tax=Streptacidiphilus sp. EB129 TaxID=3156262 RepID=UPI00351388C3